MKRLWIVLGFALGALFVYALTHADRKKAAFYREEEARMQKLDTEIQMELAVLGAIDGQDYINYSDVKDELNQYRDSSVWDV